MKFILTVPLISILFVQTSFAQDVMQRNLPEGAKARLGKGKIREIEYSPDSNILAVATTIGIWLYDTTTYQEITLLTEHNSPISNIEFNPQGQTFASAGQDNSIFLWDINTGTKVPLFGHISGFSRNILNFSLDGNTLASGNKDTIILWDAITGEHKDTITGIPNNISDFSFSPDGMDIVSVSGGGVISVTDATTGELKKSFTVKMTEGVISVGFSQDVNLIVIGNIDGIIYIVDITKGELIRKLTGHSFDVERIAFSPDGNMCASSSYGDETVHIWNIRTGKKIHTFTEHTGDLLGLAYSPDGNTLASSGSGDGTIRFWDTHTGEQKHIITGHTDNVNSMIFHPDGKHIVCGYEDGTIRYWDISTRQQVKTLDRFMNSVSGLVFTPDGKTIVGGVDNSVRIWNAQTGKHKMLLSEHKGLRCIGMSPDGMIIATGSEDTTIRLWDINTGHLTRTLKGHNHRIHSVIFTSNGQILISGSEDNTIRLWDVTTGENIKTYTAHTDASGSHGGSPLSLEGVKSLALSPDGETLASGGGDMIIHLWDYETGSTKLTLTGHRYPVFSLAFSPDGKLLASGSYDGEVRLWDTKTGELKSQLAGHSKWVTTLTFTPDGKTLFSASDDGTVLLWNINQ